MHCWKLLVLFVCLSEISGAADRIDQVLRFPQRTAGLVFRDQIKPNWAADGKSVWYRIATGPKTEEFVFVDLKTGKRTAAASLQELGLPEVEPVKTSSLRGAVRPTRRTGESSNFRFQNETKEEAEIFWVNQQGDRVPYGTVAAGQLREQHTFAGHVWVIAAKSGEAIAVVEAEQTPRTIVIDGPAKRIADEADQKSGRRRSAGTRDRGISPDGKRRARAGEGGLVIRDLDSDQETTVKIDLPSGVVLRDSIFWAPNSEALVALACAEVPRRKISIVESSPNSEIQPRLKEIDYVKPGDPLPEPIPVLIRLEKEGSEARLITSPLMKNPFRQSPHIDIRWSEDSSEFYFDHNQRGHQAYRILAVDAQTGEVRALVEEKSDTFIDYTNKTWRHWLPETGELLWMSERDGWCHLFLYDVKTGEVKNQVTRGNWVVRKVLHVDEASREVWFLAGGLRPGEDPYHQHLCRVKFDGSEFHQLTEGDGQHRIEFSPNREVFFDTWSRVDQAPIHELRNARDGKLIAVCEKADASRLLETGWSLPERFVAKGRDGKTDIYGVMIKPPGFDPAKKYPVVEEIYAGPHSAFVPKEFGRLPRQSGLAELGFVVVQIDGMGTNHRGKAFHDVCWKNLKDAGFPDRIAWIKAAADTRPWMDLSRLGIYGGSAGGQNAMRAVLDHHDFYRVAVADCGCHDNRMDKLWWNEQWLGWPLDDSYARNSNKEDAHKLQGKLLLIVGELDTNVDPASTTQVVGALQKAGKSFDFMSIVGAGHGAAETPYGSRLRMEFLVRHLHP
jgi:dipeptidyl aminopeptidase/acylaminoacyl peptidase